jgi:hypothetical protein
MKKKDSSYSGILYGLTVWQGSAQHIGRTYKQSEANLPIRAADHDKLFDRFAATDVWSDAGWLVTSTSHGAGIVRCNVRKGTQVGTLIVPEETLFFHADPSLPHEDVPWLKEFKKD